MQVCSPGLSRENIERLIPDMAGSRLCFLLARKLKGKTMYYRVEASEKVGGRWTDWRGVGQVLCGPENRKAFRGLAVPKCLSSGEYRNTRSWFTEQGWKKYKDQIMQQIANHDLWIATKTRLLTTEELPNKVMCGKMQAVENLDPYPKHKGGQNGVRYEIY